MSRTQHRRDMLSPFGLDTARPHSALAVAPARRARGGGAAVTQLDREIAERLRGRRR